MAKDSSTPAAYRGVAQSVALLVALQALVGVYLASAYRPNVLEAHGSVERLRSDTVGRVFVNFHYWGSAILIALCAALVTGMVLGGWYRTRKTPWFGALLATFCALGAQLTGNLLPLDRHDVQTAVIEAGIAERTPLVGSAIRGVMLQGEGFGSATLLAWYDAHRWVLTIGLALGALLLMAGQWRFKNTAPMMLLGTVAAMVMALTLHAPYGPAATEADFGAQDAVVSWYVWPLHGALRAFDSWFPGWGWIGSALLPTVFGAFLVFLPWLGARLSAWAVRTVFLFFALAYLAMAYFFGGTPAPAWGMQDVPQTENALNTGRNFPAVDASLAARGRTLFNSLPCAGCHGANGVGGRIGPNLSRVHRDRPDPEWLVEFIRKPSSKKPGSIMPEFASLSEADLRAIAEWLRQPK